MNSQFTPERGSKQFADAAKRVVRIATRECQSCAAFLITETGWGECHRYAPKPNYDHTLSVEWPRISGGDFCLEFVSRGGDL